MLDVHILTLGHRSERLDRAVASCRAAAEAAGFPVSIHVVEGINGHLGLSRLKGYAAGGNMYKTHVDADDWVEPDAFACLLPALSSGALAVTTGEVVHEGAISRKAPESRHHLAVYHRSVLLEAAEVLREMPMFPDQYLLAAYESTHVARCVYHYVFSSASACATQRKAAGAKAVMKESARVRALAEGRKA